nr:HAD-IA family hydrolase [Sphingomonas sp. IC-56]
MSESRPLRLVIFDFDGTLSDSGHFFMSVADQLAERFNFRRVCPAEAELLRHKSSREVIAYLGIPRWKMPLIARHLRNLVLRDAHRIELFPGTPDLLEKLDETGVKIALVTSNSERNARLILGDQHIARIDLFACGSSLFGKARKFRHVLKKLGIAPDQALAVGDETRDIDAAHEVGARAGAVLWGYASEAVLSAHRPDVLFAEPEDILDYVRRHRSPR